MVSKKRLDKGLNGFQVPVIPRAPRSIRRKGARKKFVDDNQLCAFELLAAIAGRLLQESEGSACSNADEGKLKLETCQDGFESGMPKIDTTFKSESFDHGSCAESSFVPELSGQDQNLLPILEGLHQEGNCLGLNPSFLHISSGSPENVGCDIKLGVCDEKNAENIPTSKVGGSVSNSDTFNNNIDDGIEMLLEDNKNHFSDSSVANTSTIKDPITECVNTNNILINSATSVQFPLYREPGALLRHLNHVKLGNSDDDENSFGCNKTSAKIRSYRPRPNIGNRRIGKILASKYWKVAPKLKSYDLYDTSDGMKSFYRYKKSICARERCQRAPFKKRKLFDRRGAYDQEASSESISKLPENGAIVDNNRSSEFFHRASGIPSTVKGHKKLKDPRVKFSIKSFRVPELYVEVPETATVDSLKRAVLEAVTAILGGGIRVGVVLQGKKVRDENRTLQQAGISQASNLDTLDFVLEPSFTDVSPSMTPTKLPLLVQHDVDQHLPSFPSTPNLDSGISTASEIPFATKLDEDVDNKKLIPFQESNTTAPMEGLVPGSIALIPVDPMNVESLALVPVTSKLKRNEVSQRRTRRPFSVSEVEGLVEAVENLGTGRWRDVKKRSFENADHRTYVDLKDKWKTLVHTASISPQQRRGEPVPQDLLNRVLSAHGYWSQHQSKPNGNHLKEPLKFLDSARVEMEVIGA